MGNGLSVRVSSVSAAPKLVIEGITKRYGTTTALEPTSLQVSTGEFLTLLGPSGSGKTTLLNLIAGLTPADGGRIFLDGKDITHVAPQHRGLGMVFQNYALFPHLTVAQNLAFGLDVRGVHEAAMRSRVNEVLAMVRLESFADRLPRELSGGQQQRVALARAFAYKPEVILMDEPLGALDRYLREELKAEIARLHKTLGTTIIYVTHDQEEALVLSDRICLMNNACIEQIDTAHGLYAQPKSRFSAQFLGESNLLAAQVEPDGQHAYIKSLDARVPLTQAQSVGASGHILLRPEVIDIQRANSGDWHVEAVQFIGAISRITIAHANGQKLTAMQLNVAVQKPWQVGDVVQAHWPALCFIHK